MIEPNNKKLGHDFLTKFVYHIKKICLSYKKNLFII
jgi:hypothetical protein